MLQNLPTKQFLKFFFEKLHAKLLSQTLLTLKLFLTRESVVSIHLFLCIHYSAGDNLAQRVSDIETIYSLHRVESKLLILSTG